MGGNGVTLMKAMVDFGHVVRHVLAADRINSPNSGASQDIYGAANGLVVHQPFTTINHNTATTVADTNVSVTLTGGPAYKVIIFNPSATATVYINFNAAATTSTFPLLATSYYTEEFVVTTVQVISATGAIVMYIASFT